MKKIQLLYITIIASIFCMYAQELVRSDEQPLTEELKTFWRDEAEPFFNSGKRYYSRERLSREIDSIRSKAEALKDPSLKDLLENLEIFKTQGTISLNEVVHKVENLLKTHTLMHQSDTRTLLDILSNMKRLLFKVDVQLTNFGEPIKLIPLNRKYKKIHAFADEICKANNLETPYLYVSDDSFCGGFYTSDVGRPIISLSPKVLIEKGDDAIKQLIAHELGHYYYGDRGYTECFSPEKSRRLNYFKEYRADLFAASYGYLPDLLNLPGNHTIAARKLLLDQHKKDAFKRYLFEPYIQEGSETHPFQYYPEQQLKDLPSQEQLTTKNGKTYRTLYEPYYLRHKDLPESTRTLKPGQRRHLISEGVHPEVIDNTLGIYLEPKTVEATDPHIPGKIVNTTAQPLRPPNARSLQAATQMLKALKRIGK